MTGGKGRDLDSDSTRAPREFRFEGTCSSSFAVVAVRDPPSRVFDDECEGWDPESDLRGLEAGTCLVAPRLSSRGICRPPYLFPMLVERRLLVSHGPLARLDGCD